MDMDKAPINQAHQLERRADAFKRQEKYDEAIDCHRGAVDQFSRSIVITSDPKVIESLQLQKLWNEQQIRLLYLKKIKLEKQEGRTDSTGMAFSHLTYNRPKEFVELQKKLFKTLNTHDQLVMYLHVKQGLEDRALFYKDFDIKEFMSDYFGPGDPGDTSVVIDEMRQLHCQFRSSIIELFTMLDDKNKQLDILRSYIQYLEEERSKTESIEHDQEVPAENSAAISSIDASVLSEGTPEEVQTSQSEVEITPDEDKPTLDEPIFSPEESQPSVSGTESSNSPSLEQPSSITAPTHD